MFSSFGIFVNVFTVGHICVLQHSTSMAIIKLTQPLSHLTMETVSPSEAINCWRLHLWWCFMCLCLLARQVTVAVGNSGLWCAPC